MCRKPVICYSNSKFKDIVDNKELKNTFLPNSNDPQKIADLIDEIVESKEFRDELERKEYEYVSELANPDKCAEEWDEIFFNLFKKNKSIDRKSSKIKILFLKKISILLEKIIYNKKMKKKNIQAWGGKEYERLMK